MQIIPFKEFITHSPFKGFRKQNNLKKERMALPMLPPLPTHYIVARTGYEDNLNDGQSQAGGRYVRIAGQVAVGHQGIVDEIKATAGVGDSEVIFSADSFDFDVVQGIIAELRDWEYCHIWEDARVETSKYDLTNGRKVMVIKLEAEAGS